MIEITGILTNEKEVFMKGQFPEIIKLEDLNGQNGFKLDGETSGDQSGISVSAVGDINSDGVVDLLIGAPYHAGRTGRSYMVFGGPGVGQSGDLPLSGLNGANGFKLDGEATSDGSGYSVSAAGDINSDGYTDLLIGAPYKSRCYVVFGGPGVGSSGIIALSSLNGTNGFKLDGENDRDDSGISVSAVGDINGDGYTDVVIGADGYPNGSYKGRCYVVFGGPGVGQSGDLPLSSLNGSNGFKLDGENNQDSSGYSVSAIGDINGDGQNDMVIGAWRYPSGIGKGRSYVVFGGPGVGNSGTLALSSLNGINGFKLDAENNYDYSGYSVSAAGDINDDGYADLMIGAFGYLYPEDINKGRSYVVFGGLGVGKTGDLLLSSLSGSNGFKLDGENNYDRSGWSVSAAGDINGDGYTDIVIGADGYPSGSYKGRCYVVFGGPGVGQSGDLLLSSFNGTNGFKLDGENNKDSSGHSISAAGDINGDSVDDLVIGAYEYDGAKGRSYVVFGDVPPVLVNNSLTVCSWGTIAVTSNDLGGYDRNHPNDSLVFMFTELQHGFFALKNAPTTPVMNVTQVQVRSGTLQFVHDGSTVMPSYQVTVRSTGIAWTGPLAANVTLNSIFLENNQLIINQGQVVTLTAANLKATYVNKVDGDLSFWVNGLAHGQFEYVAFPHQPIVVFQQQNITDGCVRFIHDQSINAPYYQIEVSNGTISTPPQTAWIDFDTIPLLLTNQLVINQGQSIFFTAAMLNATHPGANDSSHLRFDITELQQGQFCWMNGPSCPITYFYQQNITDGLVEFIHDNSTIAPAYNVSVTDGRTRSLSQAAQIDFDTIPILLNNTLRINQGENILITGAILSATHPTGDDNMLLFNLTDIIHGQFTWVDFSDESITCFYQRNITDHRVQFLHDNSIIAPAYTVSVTDGRTRSTFQAAQIDFDTIPVLVNNHLRINQGETISMTPELLSATHPDSNDNERLQFNVINVTHGQFHWLNSPADSLTDFYQKNISDGFIQFTHDNSTQAPAYQVSVTDGRTTSSLQSALIDFDATPILLNNTLVIDQGQVVRLTADSLSAIHPGGDDSVLLFSVNNVKQGKFSWVNFPQQEILSFYQQNITDQRVQFMHDNSTVAPGYVVVVTDGRTAAPPQPARIDFDAIPILLNNALRINQGETVVMTSDMLSATHPTGEDSLLLFNWMSLTHGEFHWVDQPSESIVHCYQQNITDGRVQFVHDNSISAPGYVVVVTDGRTVSPAQAAQIDFDASPILMNNTLVIDQGQTMLLTPASLSAIHPGGDDNQLWFNISTVQQGKFSLITVPDQSIFSFYQQNISDRVVQFSHDNSTEAPGYLVSVSDGRMTLPPVAAVIDFDVFPILENNQLVVNQGQTVVINTDNLRASHAGNMDDSLDFIISDCQHGQFQWVTAPHASITVFQQQNVTDQLVQFVHDNSTVAPVYRVAVSDGRLTTTPVWSLIDFDQRPVLVNNKLTIGEDETLTLTADNLSAIHNGSTEPGLIFIISNVNNGGFIVSGVNQLFTGDLNFSQQQVLDQGVRFSQQGSGKPAYQVSVTDGRITLLPASANVTFYVKPVLTQNQFLVSAGQSAWLTSANLAATRAGEMAEDLQFLVSSVSHGRFEKRGNPGVAILSFYQQDIMQQNIQFVADNSTQIPDCRLKVWDSSTDLSSDVQETGLILVVNNYFRINQGDTFLLTENVLKATGNRGDDGDILFSPIVGTVQHGQFELVSNPKYPLVSFQQKQISANDIVFVSDNATSAPGAYLTISNGQPSGVQGAVACQIDFDAAPWLQNTYLSTYSGDRSPITDINLKAASSTANINELVFEISEMTHGYFADKSQWQVDLTNFTQQQVMNGSIIFVTDKSGLAPEFKVSVWDGRLHCWACPQPADVVFGGGSPPSSNLSEIIKNAVIGAAVSGMMGLLFFALKYRHSLSLQRNARPMIDGAEQDTYPDTLLLPIAREVFSRIKITGCLGYIGKRQYNEYVGAVSVVVAALETKGVIKPDSWSTLSRPKKQKIIDAIAMHTKELAGNNRCCSSRSFTSFYKAEATPRMIRDQANAIADAVRETFTDGVEAKGSDQRGVRLTPVSSSLNDSGLTAPLLQ